MTEVEKPGIVLIHYLRTFSEQDDGLFVSSVRNVVGKLCSVTHANKNLLRC